MKKHIYLIDYLKAISIIMVIITHYAWEDKINGWFLFLINMAVPVFMLISGYNFSASGMRKAEGKFKNMYHHEILIPKVIRFTVPFAFVFVFEIILKIAQGEEYSFLDILLRFVKGGYGPGSYYYPIMMQLLLIFPVIYFLVKRFQWLGVFIAAGLNFVYEIIIHKMGMQVEDYRLLVFRYIFYIALGCYLFFFIEKKISVWILLLMMTVGSGYLVAVYYEGYEPHLFTYWTRTCMVTAFYIFPIVYFLFHYCMEFRIPGKLGDALSEIGKASYHIFLVQMVYYHFEFGKMFQGVSVALQVICNVAFCLSVGYLFYFAEQKGKNQQFFPVRNFVKNKGNVS